MKNALAALSILALAACGQNDADVDLDLVDEAAALAALSDDGGDPLEDVPVGTEDDAAMEAADDAEDSASATEPMRDCSLARYRERVMAQYDADGNGQLEGDEVESLRTDLGEEPQHRVRWARQHRFMRMQWIYDADGDGSLDDGERAELRADVEARCDNRQQALLEEFDANADGVLGDSEWQAAREGLIARREQTRATVMTMFDANGNGTLEINEREALIEAARTRITAARAELRAQFDLDGDGVLGTAEIAALKEHLRSRVRGEL